jgi:hypothetical protein
MIAATGSPDVNFLEDEVEGRSPGAIGMLSGAIVLAAMDTKLQVVQAWCKCDGL